MFACRIAFEIIKENRKNYAQVVVYSIREF